MFLGKDGGISVGLESVAWNTVAAAFVDQHPISATLQPRQPILLPNVLRSSLPATREYDFCVCEGDIVVAYNKSRAVIGNLLACVGALSTNDYTIGGGSDPDTKSMSVRVNHGGSMIQYTGCVPQRFRLELKPDNNAVLTLTLAGGGVTKPAAVAPNNPAESGIYMPSDIPQITVNAVACRFLGMTIEGTLPYTGTDRRGLYGGSILEPQLTSYIITSATLQGEFSGDSGADTEDFVESWIAGTALGDIAVGSDFTLNDCYMMGDGPALQDGIQGLSITVQPSSVVVTTTA